MSRFVVAADVMGIPTTQVPVPLLSDLAKFFPADEIVVTYHHATNHVMVKFPGWDAPAVQRLLDELSVETDPAFQGYVTWPGLHGAADGAPAEDAERAGKSNRFIESDFVERDTKETGHRATCDVLGEIREVMEEMTVSQQDKLSRLVCGLKTALAAERMCFDKLFESAPDGYVATDMNSGIQHANGAMYQLLQVKAPHLQGVPLVMFFTPGSQVLVLQRLRLLRTGISERQPFTDIQAKIVLGDEKRASVLVRLIAIKLPDEASSSIRWLIRQTA